MRPKALLALPLLPLLAAPGAGAAATRVLGCPAYGYALRVPSSWAVSGACSARATAASAGLTLIVTVERHGYWDDGRPRASIRGDALALGAIAGTPTFAPTSIGRRTFLGGTVVVVGADRRPLAFLELETFAAGRLYKVAARIAGLHDDAALRAIGTAPETIAIFAPGAPIPPPARATRPDAPGVAVTTEAPHADSGGDTPPPAGRRYAVVRITVANDGAGTYRATPLGFSLVDGGDRAAHGATFGDRHLGAAMLVATDVPPGQEIIGDVVFAIPRGEAVVRLYWVPTPRSPRVAVRMG